MVRKKVKIIIDKTILKVYYFFMAINILIKKYLKSNGVSQIAFARMIGVRPETVWRYVHGKSFPTRKKEHKIMKVISS